jgi:hypothetical protein
MNDDCAELLQKEEEQEQAVRAKAIANYKPEPGSSPSSLPSSFSIIQFICTFSFSFFFHPSAMDTSSDAPAGASGPSASAAATLKSFVALPSTADIQAEILAAKKKELLVKFFS